MTQLPEDHRKKLSFDPTINLGHILTFIGFLATGFGAYSTLDKRLAVQEIRSVEMETRQREQELRIKDSLQEIKSDIKDVRRSTDEIIQRLVRR